MSWRATAGLRTWLLQRLSALYIVVFLAMLVFVWNGASITYEAWRSWVAHPLANVGLVLFFAALLLHAWIGVRDVILDYVKSVAARYVLLIVIGLGLAGLGLWVLRVLLLVQVS